MIMTVDDLLRSPDYQYHHTASRRGYVSRRSQGYIEPYAGRYGKGYVWVRPRWDTSYYVYVSYYIERPR